MPQFSSDFDVISKKQKSSIFHKLICQCHFHTPPEVQGPLEAHGPPKLHGHQGHCLTSLPPFRWPWRRSPRRAIFLHCLFLSSRPSGRRGQTYKWRWRHLQAQVAPLLISGGATSKFRWRHLQLQVAPLAASSGATCSFRWRHF